MPNGWRAEKAILGRRVEDSLYFQRIGTTSVVIDNADDVTDLLRRLWPGRRQSPSGQALDGRKSNRCSRCKPMAASPFYNGFIRPSPPKPALQRERHRQKKFGPVDPGNESPLDPATQSPYALRSATGS